MSRPTQTAGERRKWLARLLPNGIPALWCPLITHYDRDGAIDQPRVAAHLRHLSPYVKGFLIPGSTGDGWELSDTETRRLLEVVLEQITKLNLHLLVGALKTEAEAALRAIRETIDWIEARSDDGHSENSLAQAGVCGFTICPPRGKELSQQQMSSALRGILETQVPVAIYQLPQVTQNAMSPELVADLARQFFRQRQQGGGSLFRFRPKSHGPPAAAPARRSFIASRCHPRRGGHALAPRADAGKRLPGMRMARSKFGVYGLAGSQIRSFLLLQRF